MDYRFEDEFHKKEMIGRWALSELQELYPATWKWPIHYTEHTYSAYDAFCHILDPDNHYSIKKRIMIEIKTRNTIYNEYILEKAKYDKLMNLRKSLSLTPSELSIYYINFTPEGVLMWDLDKIDNSVTTKTMNSKTVEESSKRKEKSIMLLSRESAIARWEYFLDQTTIIRRHYPTQCLIPKIEQIQRTRGIDLT